MTEIRNQALTAELFEQLSFDRKDVVYIAPFARGAFFRALRKEQMEVGFLIELIPFDRQTGKLQLDHLAYQFSMNPPKAVFAPVSLEDVHLKFSWEELEALTNSYTEYLIADADESSEFVVCMKVSA